VYAHERIWTGPEQSPRFLELLAEQGLDAYEGQGLGLVGAYDNALINGRECIVIWTIPEWPAWAEFERAWAADGAFAKFRSSGRDFVARAERRLLTDNPLNPMVLGRQPHEDDRRPMSEL
jgi:hypothetical protein